jgi:hypothetical protein
MEIGKDTHGKAAAKDERAKLLAARALAAYNW